MDDIIVSCYLHGGTLRKTAHTYNISEKKVKDILLNNGIGVRKKGHRLGEPPPNKGTGLSIEEKINSIKDYHNKIIELYNNGKTTYEIHKELSLPRFVVRLFINNYFNRDKKFGGYRRGSGNGISGIYKNIFCDSQYELAFVIDCEQKGIIPTKVTNEIKFIHNNKETSYVPDFLINDVYYEIKPPHIPFKNNIAKLSSFPYKLIIVSGNEMSNMVKNAIALYGTNYWDVYKK